ncbi:MAG TPA: hypothetical protein VM013_01525 [Dehalococcoidia bacterium]|nr:hypothetical protein [Dehalococcoidia bacterium]HUX16507.1 hypothetical protein [Phycisphaerae bacterium]
MANFLTDGRTAVIAALQGDATIGPLVKTWRDWGPGLRERFLVDAAHCPLVAIYPSDATLDYRYDIGKDLPQDLIMRVVAAEHPADAEEIIAPAITRVELSTVNMLGLVGEGLKDIVIQSWRWAAYRDEKAALVLWDVAVILRLLWVRRRAT